MKLINNKDRRLLNEGRNYGFGIAICKKINNDTLETIIPITACKDYLNDVVYNELTKNSISCYGLNLKKSSNIFEDKKCYLACQILKINNSFAEYASYNKDLELFKNNQTNFIVGINQIEELLNLNEKTKILKSKDDNIMLLQCPKYWFQTTWLISMYSLFLRNMIYYQADKNIIDFLNNFNKDNYMLKDACFVLNYLQKTDKIEIQTFNNMQSYNIHNFGISAFKKTLKNE